MTHLVRLESDFEGKPLVTLTHDGRLAWVARQVGAALGYANRGKRLVNKITSDWADEFIAGRQDCDDGFAIDDDGRVSHSGGEADMPGFELGPGGKDRFSGFEIST